MPLELENILITGRTYEEYTAFFDLDENELVGKKVLDCPSGASSFIATARSKGIDAQGVDILYENKIEDIYTQGKVSIEKIYEDSSWMDGHNFEFYGSIENHRNYRENALEDFAKHYNDKEYSFMSLPKLEFADRSFDLLLSSHLLFVYDDRFDYEFHKNSVLEMLRVSKEVRIFPLIDFQNKHLEEEKNFSPFVYKLLEELKEFQCEIVKVGFEFQPRAGYMLKILNNRSMPDLTQNFDSFF